MIKDTNEVLKFLVFMLNLLATTSAERSSMHLIINMAGQYINALGLLDSDKVLFVLKHFYLGIVVERIEKANEINQYLIIKTVFAFSELNDKMRLEVLKLVLSLVKSKEILFKFFEVWTDEENHLSVDKPKEGTYLIKGILKETKINTSISQRAFFFKILVNFMETDLPYVEKIFFYYEDMLFERHSEPLKSVAMYFLTKFYSAAFKREMSFVTQEKSQFGKENKAQLEMFNRQKQPTNKLLYILKKIDELLDHAGPIVFKVYFLQMSELIDSSVRLLEQVVTNLLKHSEKDIRDYLEGVQMSESEDLSNELDTNDIAEKRIWLKPEFLSNHLKFSWIILGNQKFENNVFAKNSASIISFLLKNVSLENKSVNEQTFWFILRFCFKACKFEALNFEYFDFIMNAAFSLLLARLQAGVRGNHLDEILEIIIRFEIKREVSIKDFETNFDQLLNNPLLRDLMVSMMRSLFQEIEENEVYSSSFKARFGAVLNY